MERLETVSWENLLPPLLELILEHLPCADYLRFTGVCSSWRDVQQDHRIRHVAFPRYQRELPWLLFENQQYIPKKVFYNPTENRYYSLPLPINYYYEKVSNYGWFYADSVITNPFTGSQILIPSPPPPEKNHYRSNYWKDLFYVPTDTNCVLECNFSDDEGTSVDYFYRLSDKTLTRLEHPVDINVVCGGKFYGLSFDHKSLTQVELFPVPIVRKLDMYMADDVNLSKNPDYPDCFMVVCDGNILLVQIFRTYRDENIYYKLQILRADLSLKVWVKLESLGNNTLFLCHWTNTGSFSMSAEDTGRPGNRVNFWKSRNQETLIEYDNENHVVIQNKIPEHDWITGGCFVAWLVPSL